MFHLHSLANQLVAHSYGYGCAAMCTESLFSLIISNLDDIAKSIKYKTTFFSPL